MLRRLRGMVLDNFGLKLFALVLAVVMFRFVRGGQDQVAATEVKLLLKLPAKTLLVSDPVAGVRVTLRGAGSTLGSVTRKPLTYTLDLTNAEIGPSQYELYTDMFRPLFPPDVMVIRIAPSVLNIVLDHKSVRTVPVILRVKGKPAFGYRVVRPFSVVPKRIRLSGPTSKITKISSILTQVVDLTGQDQDLKQRVPLALPGRQISVEGSSRVRVTVGIRSISAKKILEAVPVLPLNPASARLKVTLLRTKVRVTLFGPLATLQGLRPADVAAEADCVSLARRKPGRYEVPLKVRVSASGVRILEAPRTVVVTTSNIKVGTERRPEGAAIPDGRGPKRSKGRRRRPSRGRPAGRRNRTAGATRAGGRRKPRRRVAPKRRRPKVRAALRQKAPSRPERRSPPPRRTDPPDAGNEGDED